MILEILLPFGLYYLPPAPPPARFDRSCAKSTPIKDVSQAQIYKKCGGFFYSCWRTDEKTIYVSKAFPFRSAIIRHECGHKWGWSERHEP